MKMPPYRDKIEELAARARGWEEHPKEAPLDMLAWPPNARLLWQALEHVVRKARGVVAIPRSVETPGPINRFFLVDGATVPTLEFVRLVRTYFLIHDGWTPRQGISPDALALIVVALHKGRPAPMLLPMFAACDIEAVGWWSLQQLENVTTLHAKARDGGQQPASIQR